MSQQETLKIVVEGRSDATILRALLGNALSRKISFFAGQGRVSLASVGRNILVHEGGPLLLVMDSDTLNPHLTEERQALASVALSRVAHAGQFKVFMFVPEIEVIVFEAPQVLARILKQPVAEDIIEKGLTVPKETLTDLFRQVIGGTPYDAYLEANPELAEGLASGKQAREFRDTVEAMLRLVPQP